MSVAVSPSPITSQVDKVDSLYYPSSDGEPVG
jgi:hypothetical protein